MVQIILSTISEPGEKINEDLINFTNNAFWLMDGATGLWNRNITGKNDALWFVSAFNKYLEQNINKRTSLKNIIKRGITETAEKWEKIINEKNIKKIPPYAEPSSSIVLVRFNRKFTKFEYFVLGDSVLTFLVDGYYMVITDQKLRKLDEIAIKSLHQYLLQGYSFEEARGKISSILKKNRAMKNTHEGYWILSFQEEAVNHAFTGKIKIKHEAYIISMSDGLDSIITDYKVFSTHKEFIKYMKYHKTFNEVYRILRAIENSDSNCVIFPRFKQSDDASGIYFEILL